MKKFLKVFIAFALFIWNLLLIALYFIFNSIEGYAISNTGSYVVDRWDTLFFYSSNHFVTSSISFSESVRIIPKADSESVWIHEGRRNRLVEYDYDGNKLSIKNDVASVMFPYPESIVNGDYYIKHQNIWGYEKLFVGQISTSSEVELDFCRYEFIKKIVIFGAFILFGDVTGIAVYFMLSKSLR